MQPFPRAGRWSELTDLDPRPIEQLARRALPAHARSVADHSQWDCPGHHTPDLIARAAAVTEYAVRLAGRADLLGAARDELAGYDLACTCPLDSGPCHRDVLLDIANPPANPFSAGGRAMGLTVRRPWASMLLVPNQCGAMTIDARSWGSDYRGPVVLIAGSRVDEYGIAAAEARGLDADWHLSQTGWLGAVVLVDIHRVRRGCCAGRRRRETFGCITGFSPPRHGWRCGLTAADSSGCGRCRGQSGAPQRTCGNQNNCRSRLEMTIMELVGAHA